MFQVRVWRTMHESSLKTALMRNSGSLNHSTSAACSLPASSRQKARFLLVRARETEISLTRPSLRVSIIICPSPTGMLTKWNCWPELLEPIVVQWGGYVNRCFIKHIHFVPTADEAYCVKISKSAIFFSWVVLA